MAFYQGNFTIFHPQLQELSSVWDLAKETKKLQVLLLKTLFPPAVKKNVWKERWSNPVVSVLIFSHLFAQTYYSG